MAMPVGGPDGFTGSNPMEIQVRVPTGVHVVSAASPGRYAAARAERAVAVVVEDDLGADRAVRHGRACSLRRHPLGRSRHAGIGAMRPAPDAWFDRRCSVAVAVPASCPASCCLRRFVCTPRVGVARSHALAYHPRVSAWLPWWKLLTRQQQLSGEYVRLCLSVNWFCRIDCRIDAETEFTNSAHFLNADPMHVAVVARVGR